MAKSSTAKAFDTITTNSVDMVRLEAGLYDEFRSDLNMLMRDVRAVTNRSELEALRWATRLRTLDNIRDKVNTLIDGFYESVGSKLTESLRGVADVASQNAVSTITNGAAPSARRLASLPDRLRFQGATMQEWLDGQAAATAARVNTALGESFASGSNLAQTLSNVLGSTELGFRDGAFGASMREGRALIRTSVQATANAARNMTWKSNSNKIAFLEWVSILDGRTTPMCLVRAGKLYTLEGSPVGHGYSWGGGPGFLHWGCRSYSVPVYRMSDAMGDKADYEDWLSDQSEDFQDETLGKTRAELFRNGQLGFSDLVNAHGTRPLNLKQIYKKIGG